MNVVLVIMDTLRRDHVGCYGNEWIQTPFLDQFATESIRFADAYPESLPTIEARQGMYTGIRLFPFNNHKSIKGDGVRWGGWHPIDDAKVTLSEILANSDYRTGLITDVYHQMKPGMNFHRGFHQFQWIRGQEGDAWKSSTTMAKRDISSILPPSMVGTVKERALRRYLANVDIRQSEEDYFAPQVFRAGMRFLEDNRDDDFFLVIDSFDPHEPWDPPDWYSDQYNPGYDGQNFIWPTTQDSSIYSDEETKQIRALYAGEVTMTDRWFGHFMSHLEQLGLKEKTLVVVLSDHGHPLGERGAIGKFSPYLYPELLDIVLMIRRPDGADAGKVVDGYVYDHDLLPTILEFLQVDAPMKVDGVSLWPMISGTEGGRDYITCSMGSHLAYVDREYWYICERDGSEPKLYPMENYPSLDVDVAPQNPDICALLYKRLLDDAGGVILPIDEESLRQVGPWYEQV